MKMWILTGCLLSCAAAARAQADLNLPAHEPFVFHLPSGRLTSETRLPAGPLLNRTRASSFKLELGAYRYHLSFAVNRDDAGYCVLVPEDGNVHEPAAVLPLRLINENSWYAFSLRGRNYFARRRENANLVFSPAQETGPDAVIVPLYEVHRAVFAAAAPLDSMGPGPEWRLIYQTELWENAGARSLVFMKLSSGEYYYHVVAAEAIDSPREHIVDIGAGRKAAVSMDEKNQFVIRPLQ